MAHRRSPAYRQHYPGNMLCAGAWCRKCKKETSHRIFNHRLSNVCIPCQESDEREHQEKLRNPAPAVSVQEELFA
jgi:hypothetical protein